MLLQGDLFDHASPKIIGLPPLPRLSVPYNRYWIQTAVG